MSSVQNFAPKYAYIRWHFDEIIIRGKSTADPFPQNPTTGDRWYDIATDKNWVYITLSSDTYTRSMWVQAPF